MSHILLAFITMGIVWYAWQNFKWLGRLKASDAHLSDEEKQRKQMSHVMRIVVCLLVLAMLPFVFTFIIK